MWVRSHICLYYQFDLAKDKNKDIFKTEKGNTTQKESPKSFNQSNNINHKPKNLLSEENPPRAKELVQQKCNNNEKVK